MGTNAEPSVDIPQAFIGRSASTPHSRAQALHAAVAFARPDPQPMSRDAIAAREQFVMALAQRFDDYIVRATTS